VFAQLERVDHEITTLAVVRCLPPLNLPYIWLMVDKFTESGIEYMSYYLFKGHV